MMATTPTFVVAADKGTAHFSRISQNEISIDMATGSGMPLLLAVLTVTTIRKWRLPRVVPGVSVQASLQSLDVNTQQDLFTVVGVGDIAGDVFGNGMLLSDKIQLVGAFNHLHIFVDPNPDAAAAFAERRRMFNLPRSSWEDYNAELISQGGGVFSRSAKSIPITSRKCSRCLVSKKRAFHPMI